MMTVFVWTSMVGMFPGIPSASGPATVAQTRSGRSPALAKLRVSAAFAWTLPVVALQTERASSFGVAMAEPIRSRDSEAVAPLIINLKRDNGRVVTKSVVRATVTAAGRLFRVLSLVRG